MESVKLNQCSRFQFVANTTRVFLVLKFATQHPKRSETSGSARHIPARCIAIPGVSPRSSTRQPQRNPLAGVRRRSRKQCGPRRSAARNRIAVPTLRWNTYQALIWLSKRDSYLSSPSYSSSPLAWWLDIGLAAGFSGEVIKAYFVMIFRWRIFRFNVYSVIFYVKISFKIKLKIFLEVS